MVWRTPTYSNDDILSTHINQLPTYTLPAIQAKEFIRGFSAVHPASHPTQGFIREFSAVHPASHPTQGIY
jgi:hypothetical protein